MIDLTTFFGNLGVVGGNTNATNQYEFFKGIQWSDGDTTNSQYEFFKKVSISRYEFFKQYTNETEFYKNTSDARIYDFYTFYTYAGEYLITVVNNWILSDGTWNDSKFWVDTEVWID